MCNSIVNSIVNRCSMFQSYSRYSLCYSLILITWMQLRTVSPISCGQDYMCCNVHGIFINGRVGTESCVSRPVLLPFVAPEYLWDHYITTSRMRSQHFMCGQWFFVLSELCNNANGSWWNFISVSLQCDQLTRHKYERTDKWQYVNRATYQR